MQILSQRSKNLRFTRKHMDKTSRENSGLIFKFKFLMLITLACAAMTVIFFIVSQVSGPQEVRMRMS